VRDLAADSRLALENGRTERNHVVGGCSKNAIALPAPFGLDHYRPCRRRRIIARNRNHIHDDETGTIPRQSKFYIMTISADRRQSSNIEKNGFRFRADHADNRLKAPAQILR
jgi:hypothetical protein